MQVKQTVCRQPHELAQLPQQLQGIQANLLLVFGDIGNFSRPDFAATLRDAAPGAILLGCSTAGEITGEGVEDGSCVVTAIRFESSRLTPAATVLTSMDDSFAAGQRLGQMLSAGQPKAVLVFGPGTQINGSALIDGIAGVIGQDVPITGGLAGDGGAFAKTFTLGPDGVSSDQVVAVGLSGDRLRFGHGSFGGWEPFGPARKVTRCTGNVLFELDGEPALEIYRRYLGDHAKDLPASGLLFPFAMLGEDHSAIGLIRTILGIDEEQGALILAGEIHPDGYLRLMHATTDRLVDGAESAAKAAADMLQQPDTALALLVSCVGRKLVMGNRIDEEVEAVRETLGGRTPLTGFYSYGEISPFLPGAACKLHNQTMTITCFSET